MRVGNTCIPVGADARRAEHQRKLENSEQRASMSECKLTNTRQKLSDVEACLKQATASLDQAKDVRLDLQKSAVLRDGEILELKARSSMIAAESGVAIKELMIKLGASEEARKTDRMRRKLEVGVLRDAFEAKENRLIEDMAGVPDFENRKLAFENNRLHEMRRALEGEKLDVERCRSTMQNDNDAREKRFEHERLRILHQNSQELTAGRANLNACRRIDEEANRVEKERLVCLKLALDSERASIARDRSTLDVERSKLDAERTEFRAMYSILEPRFRDADSLEHRAAQREKAATKAENDARAAAAGVKLDKLDLDEREAAASEADQAVVRATQRAEQMMRFACTHLALIKQKAIQVEQSKYVISQQQFALARQVIAVRRAASTIKRAPTDSGGFIRAYELLEIVQNQLVLPYTSHQNAMVINELKNHTNVLARPR